MIKFQSVSKIYPANHLRNKVTAALENVSFEIKDKEFVLVSGRSGAGKTTLVKLIIGAEKPSAGRIFFDKMEVNKIRKQDLPKLRRRIGVVFQDYKLLPLKTVFENVAYALEVAGAEDKEIKETVPQALKIVGLENRAGNFPSELSGGEKQRAALARALVNRPELLIADEPTGNLDPFHTWDIIHLLQKINEMGTTVILATHDQEIINGLEKRVITLEEGRLIHDEEKGKFVL